MVITHNISAMNAQRNLGNNQKAITGNLEKMSSGYKINRAADDASGLCTSEKMRASVSQLDVCVDNCEMGRNLVRVADGAIEEIHAMCNRMVELSVLSANGTFDNEVDRAALQEEMDQLVEEIDRIVETTNYNGIPLLNRDDFIISDMVEEYLSSYSTSTAKHEGIGTDVDGDGLYISSSYYQSGEVSIPDEALSIPDTVTLPYEIQTIYTCYNDDTSSLGSADISHQVVTLRVESDGSVVGWSDAVSTSELDSYTPSGTGKVYYNGTTETSLIFNQTGKDAANLATGTSSDSTLYYVSPYDDGKYVSSSEMQYIMNDLLETLPYGLTGGGSQAVNTAGSTFLNYPSQQNVWTSQGYSYKSNANGSYNWYKNGVITYDYSEIDEIHSSNFTSAQQYAGLSSSTSYYGDTFDSSIWVNANGSTLQTGRLLGSTTVVTSGAATLVTSETPSDFDPEDWDSLTDMEDLTTSEILGVKSIAETSRHEISIGENYYTFDELSSFTKEEIQDLVVTIRQETEIKDVDGVQEVIEFQEENYIVVVKPILETVMQQLSDMGLNVLAVEPTDRDCDYVDTLADQIADDFGIRCVRKLDNSFDLHIDDNETNKYTLELGFFTQNIDYYTLVGEDYPDPIVIQAGEHGEEYDRIYIYIDPLTDEVETLKQVDISTQEAAGGAVDVIRSVINDASLVRSDLGAYENRLDIAANVDRTVMEYLQSAETQIRDTDIAEEMMAYTKNNILIESSQAMMAQANNLPQGVLQLLG